VQRKEIDAIYGEDSILVIYRIAENRFKVAVRHIAVEVKTSGS